MKCELPVSDEGNKCACQPDDTNDITWNISQSTILAVKMAIHRMTDAGATRKGFTALQKHVHAALPTVQTVPGPVHEGERLRLRLSVAVAFGAGYGYSLPEYQERCQ